LEGVGTDVENSSVGRLIRHKATKLAAAVVVAGAVCFYAGYAMRSSLSDKTPSPLEQSGEALQTTADPAPSDTNNVSQTGPSLETLFGNWNGTIFVGNNRYGSGDTIYFTGDAAEFHIALDSPVPFHNIIADLKKFKDDYVTETVEDPEKRKQMEGIGNYLSLSVDSSEPHLIHGRIYAPYALRIDFAAGGQGKPFSFLFSPTEPFTYTISTPFNEENTTTETRHYLEVGKTHTFNVEFSLPVDPESIKDVIWQGYGEQDVDWKIDWVNDRTLTLSLNLQEKDLPEVYDQLSISFAGAVSKSGVKLSDSIPYYRFQPSQSKKHTARSPVNNRIEQSFKSIVNYTSLELSQTGGWILASEERVAESMLFRHYTLLDKDGNRRKSLGEFRISPVWLPDGKSLIYSGEGKVIQYDIPTGVKRIVREFADEIPAYVDYRFDYNSGRLIVGALINGDQSSRIDLFMYESIDDSSPYYLKDAIPGFVLQDMELDGLGYRLPYNFVDADSVSIGEDQIFNWKTRTIVPAASQGAAVSS